MVLNRYIVVSGLPASGKSTVARAIADALRLPRLDKDEILEGLFDTLGVGDLAWRHKLSRAADDELRRQACALPGAVIVSWWRHPGSVSESGTPTEWLSSLAGELVEMHCVCSPRVAATRFVSRKRHAGHLDGQKSLAAVQASFEAQASLGPLKLGRVLEVNTEVSLRAGELLARLAG
jgi:hypothetical protein